MALRIVTIVALLSVVIMPGLVSAASGPGACNRTNEVIYLAIAWWGRDHPGLHSEGWYTFKPGECAQVFPEDSYDAHRYYYAESATRVWKGDGALYCIHPTKPFEIADAYGDCPAPYEQRHFRTFSDNGVDLTGGQ